MKEKLQSLSPAQALSGGAPLWVLSNPEYSSWNYQIDWYLSFLLQKTRLSSLKNQPISSDSLIKKYKLSNFQWTPPSPFPILIDSSSCLPNLWTLELEYSSQWLHQVYEIWNSLDKPGLRIFAPKPIQKKEIEKKWKRYKNIYVQYIIAP